MSRVQNTGLRRLVVIFLAGLMCGALAGSGLAQETPNGVLDAAQLLAAGNASMDSGNLADAARNYVQLLDQYPAAAEAYQVHANMGTICTAASEADLDAVEAALPPVDKLNNFDSKFLVGCVYYGRYLRARDDGNLEKARSYFTKTCDVAWAMMWDHPYDLRQTTVVEKVFQMGRELGSAETDVVLAKLMQATTELGSCPATWPAAALLKDQIPAFDSFTAPEDKFDVCEFYRAWAEQAKELGDAQEVRDYYAKARDAAWTLMWAYPENPAQIRSVQTYLESVRSLDPESALMAVALLETKLDEQPPSMTAWAAHFALPALFHELVPDPSQRVDHFTTLLTQRDEPFLTKGLSDPSVKPVYKAWIQYAIGLACQMTQQYDQAKLQYETVIAEYPQGLEPVAAADFGQAWVTSIQNPGDPTKGVAAFDGYIDRHPAGPYTDWALLKIGDIHLEAGNTDAAKTVYEQVIQKYPDYEDIITEATTRLTKCSDGS